MTDTLTILTLFLFTLTSCSSQQKVDKELKQFDWTEGAEPKNEYRYHVSLSTTDKVYTIGGDDGGSFEVYDTNADSWTTLDSLPTPRLFIGGTILANSIYVTGGMDYSKKYSSTVEKYDIIEKKWTACKDLTVSRSRLAAVAYNGKIYAIGGLEGIDDKAYKNSTVVEQYDPLKDSWTRKADMPTPRHGHSVVLIKNKILVVGGYTDAGPTGIVEEYDAVIDKWITKSEMPTPRGFFGLVTIDNYIYAIAGRVRQDKGPIERYDFENDLWTQLDPMPGWRNRFGIAQLDKKVYIIGGENNPKSTLIGELKNK